MKEYKSMGSYYLVSVSFLVTTIYFIIGFATGFSENQLIFGYVLIGFSIFFFVIMIISYNILVYDKNAIIISRSWSGKKRIIPKEEIKAIRYVDKGRVIELWNLKQYDLSLSVDDFNEIIEMFKAERSNEAKRN